MAVNNHDKINGFNFVVRFQHIIYRNIKIVININSIKNIINNINNIFIHTTKIIILRKICNDLISILLYFKFCV